MIISAGPTNSSLPRGCSPWLRPGSWRANPDEETTDWRAVCGRTARTVRRAGRAKALSDPYRVEEGTMWKEIPPFSFSAGERKIMAHFVVRNCLVERPVSKEAVNHCAVLGADLGAHENDVRDAEANGHQPKEGRDMGPDEDQTLIQRERRRENALGLALKRQAEYPGCGVEQDADAFRKKRARRDAINDVDDIGLVGKLLRGRRVRDNDSGDGLAKNGNEQRHKQPNGHGGERRSYGFLKKQGEEQREGEPEADVEDPHRREDQHAPEFLGVGREAEQRDP